MKRTVQFLVAAAVAAGLLAWPTADFDRAKAYAEAKEAKDNLHLLAQTVCGEARGEPYEGKVAVAAVTLNRTLDDRFPDSVAGVVYQTHAYESVDNGELYGETTEECYKAARAALAGWDPVNGALYFYAPAKVVHGWMASRELIRVIGGHEFSR